MQSNIANLINVPTLADESVITVHINTSSIREILHSNAPTDTSCPIPNNNTIIAVFNKTLKGTDVGEFYENAAQQVAGQTTIPYTTVSDTLLPEERECYHYLFPTLCQRMRHQFQRGVYTALAETQVGLILTITR